MNKGILFVMSGPSGTGKGTICKELIEREDIFLSVSSTSREIRKDEIPGVTYNYVTEEQFKFMIDNDEMLEWAVYSGNYYGTPKRTVNEYIDEGKNVLLEIEPQGALTIKRNFPEAVLIFVVPPSMAELKKRLTERGRESREEILRRMEAAKWEFEQSPKYNYTVVNDDLERCVNEVLGIIHKQTECRGFVEKLLNEKY